MIRTRFAPSPTGYLHIGGARTALFSWAYARKHGGKFVLRIEDTDLERSTAQSTQAILEGMAWLGLDYDEGPFYQMQRLERYHEVAEQLLSAGHAYYCYCSREELDAMREQQRAAGLKPRYDGRWRDSKETPPAGVKPVVRLKNPLDGEVTFKDLIKGEITVANSELDDLVLLRGDGVPTYNFGVVIDDLDMNITHVIRGDDHVNNTPRQINILKALGAPLPQYAHVPMILGADGERLSKRHGAVSVMQYREDGYLPEALVNYLARLGWSHGDEEIFSREQLVEWFDLSNINRSPAKFNPEKLQWLNQQYLKTADNERLAELVKPFLTADGCDVAGGGMPDLRKVVNLLKERVNTVAELADAAVYFFRPLEPGEELRAQYFTAEAKVPILDLRTKLATVEWESHAINDAIKAAATVHGLKMPKVAMPLRVMVTGEAQTPAINLVLELLGREETLRRMDKELEYLPR
ncbi:MAG TPA: glutamate--tRNA ligase [Nitrosospira sp.]|nr:glutamate--tRNA ligase [Nitrosospira sp.]